MGDRQEAGDAGMLSTIRTRAYILAEVAAVVAGLTVAAPLARADAPFRATFQEQFSLASCPAGTAPGLACAVGIGEGQATHLGRALETLAATINPAAASPAGCIPDQSTATLIAANGDRLTLATSGSECLGADGTAVDSGTYRVAGGSGRFAGARGEGTYRTLARFGAGGTTGSSVSTYEGSLSLAGRDRDGRGAADVEG